MTIDDVSKPVVVAHKAYLLMGIAEQCERRVIKSHGHKIWMQSVAGVSMQPAGHLAMSLHHGWSVSSAQLIACCYNTVLWAVAVMTRPTSNRRVVPFDLG